MTIVNPFPVLDGLGRLGQTKLWYRDDMVDAVKEVCRGYPAPEYATIALVSEYMTTLSLLLGTDTADRVRDLTVQVGPFPEENGNDRFSVFVERTGPRVQLNTPPAHEDGLRRARITASLCLVAGMGLYIGDTQVGRLLSHSVLLRGGTRHLGESSIVWFLPLVEP